MIEGTKDDNGKMKLSRVPPELIEAVARVRDFGDRKYTDPENWKHIAPERWHEALLRHVLAIWNDPMHIDEESGLPSLWHVACNAAFLCAQGNQLNPFWKETPFEDTEIGNGDCGTKGPTGALGVDPRGERNMTAERSAGRPALL